MAKQLSDKTKKNLLDLEFNKNLQYYNTAIILLFTYVTGTFIAFITKQINYKNAIQLSLVIIISIGFVGVIIFLILKFKNNLAKISREIKKLKL